MTENFIVGQCSSRRRQGVSVIDGVQYTDVLFEGLSGQRSGYVGVVTKGLTRNRSMLRTKCNVISFMNKYKTA
jgi:hypothetical protein